MNILRIFKSYRNLEQNNNHLQKELSDANNKLKKLEAEQEKLVESGPYKIKEGNSSILFEIDNELSVTIKSLINEEIVNKLIDAGYLSPEQSNDEAAIQLVFILLANEVTEQIIMEVNENAQE